MSSTAEQPQVQMQRRDERQGFGKLIAAGVFAVLIVVLILQNTKVDWRFHFFFWWFSLPAWLMLVVLLIAGFLIGTLTSALLRRRKKRELKRRARNM